MCFTSGMFPDILKQAEICPIFKKGDAMNVCTGTINTFNNKLKNVDTQTLINDELSKIIEWLNINKLSLNKDKSKYMIFHMHKKEIPSFSLKLGNTNIKKVDDFNYLGLTVDTNLN